MTLEQRRLLFAGTIAATGIKLWLAWFTHGTTDVDGFTDHLVKIRQLGVGAYHVRGPFDNPFNSPPPMIYGIRAIGWLSDLTSLSFGFWLRLFPIIASVVIVLLAYRMLRDRADQYPLLLALVLSPVSIIIDGYHGNTDSVVIMFVLLAIYLTDRPILSGLAFALGCCVKVFPLMFVPAFLLYLPTMKTRAQFTLTAAGVFFFASLPFIFQDPSAIKNAVLGYGSIYGSWGVPQIAAIVSPVAYVHQPFEPLGIHGMIASGLKYLTLVLIVVLSLRMRGKPLLVQCGIITSLVLLLAPGFGPQYLVWMVPFVLMLGLRTTAIYYTLASLYLLYKYTGIVEISWLVPLGFAVSLCCWLFFAVMLTEYRRLNLSATSLSKVIDFATP